METDGQPTKPTHGPYTMIMMWFPYCLFIKQNSNRISALDVTYLMAKIKKHFDNDTTNISAQRKGLYII